MEKHKNSPQATRPQQSVMILYTCVYPYTYFISKPPCLFLRHFGGHLSGAQIWLAELSESRNGASSRRSVSAFPNPKADLRAVSARCHGAGEMCALPGQARPALWLSHQPCHTAAVTLTSGHPSCGSKLHISWGISSP